MSEADPAIGAGATTAWHLGPIVDADAHVEPPHDMWQQYLPENLRSIAPRIERGEEHDWIVSEDGRRPLVLISNQAGRNGENFKMQGRIEDMRAVWEPATRIADMDTDGIDAAILFGGGPIGTFNNDLYIASYDAYNRWVMDFCSVAPKRLIPVAYCPMRDIEETIEHVTRAAKMGFKTINLPAFPQNPDGWSTSSKIAALQEGRVSALTGDPKGKLQFSQPEFDRLWAVLQDLNLVVSWHLGGRVPRFRDKQHFLPDMPMSKVAMAESIAIMLFSGVFQRFPGLKVATIESGVGWFAWFTEYMDRTWEKQRFWTESPLTQPPSFYMEQNVWGSFIQDRAGILSRDLPGGRNIMWSSDYPHSETTWPNSRAIILRDFDGIPDDDIRDIICNNARKLYQLEF